MMSKAISFLLAAAALALAPAAHAQSAAEGEKKASMCIGCHGIQRYQASFPEVYKVPMIAGQNAGYIASSLAAYKKGERKHPTMRGVAGSLTDADMADLAAFYAQYGASSVKPVADAPAAAASTEVAGLLAKGACASCHGANFSKPIAPAYPKLAGQHADYLYAALRAYGTQGNPHVGRGNAIMVVQVKPFKHDELKAMAKYLASLPGEIHTESHAWFR